MTLTEQEEILVRKWKEDPLELHRAISSNKLWQKQREILHAVRKYNRIAVKSGNTVGKTRIAAEIVIDWLFTNYPSKVITTSSSWTQVEDVLWKEIRNLWLSSPYKFKGELLNTALKFNDQHFAIGLSVDKPVRLQGFHSPNLLVLIDEASGIEPEIWDMVEALHPKTILAIGNPIDPNGKFADCFTSCRWHKITINCLEAVEWQDKNVKIPGLVTREWIKDMADLHGLKSPWYKVHIEGNFPEQDEAALIERQWVDRARKGLDADGLPIDDEDETREYRLVSWDVASKHGECENVVCYRFGHTIAQMQGWLRQTTTFVRDQVELIYTQKKCKIVCVDADGIGENVAEFMSEVSIPCLEFHGGYGAKAIDQTKFKNLRSQFYWLVAKKFEKGFYNLKHLDDKSFELLRGQLCSIRQKQDDALGRVQVETKEDLLARGIKSPDFADALMMSEFAMFKRNMQGLEPIHYGRL